MSSSSIPKKLSLNVSDLSSVLVHEGMYYVKKISNVKDKEEAHKLRYKVFCEELGWVQPTSSSMEVDVYDGKALFFGVYDNCHNLKAFLRVVMSSSTFMLEKEFPYMQKHDYKIRKKTDTAEISRLCVAPEARSEKLSGNFGVHSVSILLFKGVYNWCLRSDIRYLYLVVEQKIHRMLSARGFPCKLVGDEVLMPDGVIALAAILDLREFEETGMVKRKAMFDWFKQNQSSHSLSQWPQRGIYLPH